MTEQQTLSKYKFVCRLGQGGMAVVFLAVSQGAVGFTKLQVVKALHANLAQNPEFVQMFLEEARLAALLNHPNVVQTHEVDVINNRAFLVMEYLEGQSLHAIIKRGEELGKPIGVASQMRVLIEALAGLHYAHELRDLSGNHLNLVHRDITPHNVFVTYDGGVKLLDFGIAKATSTSVETRSGVIKGKVRYMAPEQVTAIELDRRADIFQVGVMLCEAAMGWSFWEPGQSDYLILNQLFNGVLPTIERPDRPIDSDLLPVCAKAVAPKREHRFSTAEEMQQALERVLASRGCAVSCRDVGRQVAALFSKERAATRSLIEATLPKIQALGSAAQDVFSASLDTLYDAPVLSDGSAKTTGGIPPVPVETGQAVTTTSQAPRPVDRKHLVRWTGAALGVVLTSGAIYAAFRKDASDKPAGVATQTTVPASVSAVSPPAPSRILISVRVEPASARIWIDGQQQSRNPWNADALADGSQHTLRVELDGYQPIEQVLVWDRSQQIRLSLTKLEAPTKPGPAKGTPRGKTSPTSPATTTQPTTPPHFKTER